MTNFEMTISADCGILYTAPSLYFTCARTQDFPSFLLLVYLRLRLSLALSVPSSMRQNKTNPEHFHVSLLHCYSAGEGKFLQNPFIDDQTHGLTSFSLYVIFISLHSLGHFGKKFLFSTSPLIIQEKKSHAV